MTPAARILVVEDAALVAEDLREIVTSLGLEALPAAASAAGALALAAAHRPDLVLMDVRLEGEVDGISAAEQLRARLAIPVVFVTAHADDLTLARALRTTPLGYLTKPFTRGSVAAAVRTALQQQRAAVGLRESLALAFAAIHEIADGVVGVSAAGEVTFANRVARALMAVDGEPLGRPLGEVLHTAPPLSAVLDAVFDGAPRAECEAVVTTSTGEQRRRVSVIPVRDAGARAFGVLVQLTELDAPGGEHPATLCSYCRQVRRQDGQWEPLEVFVARSFSYMFSHGLCPSCLPRVFPDEAGSQ